MNKQDLIDFTNSKVESLVSAADALESVSLELEDTERKQALKDSAAMRKKALWISRFADTLNDVGGLLVTVRVSTDTLDEIFSDHYSLEKLTALFRALQTESAVKHSSENSLAEFLRVCSESDFAELENAKAGKQMRTLHGMRVLNGTADDRIAPEFHSSGRQFDMCAKLLQRLGACERSKLNDAKANRWNESNAIAKRIMDIYSAA